MGNSVLLNCICIGNKLNHKYKNHNIWYPANVTNTPKCIPNLICKEISNFNIVHPINNGDSIELTNKVIRKQGLTLT